MKADSQCLITLANELNICNLASMTECQHIKVSSKKTEHMGKYEVPFLGVTITVVLQACRPLEVWTDSKWPLDNMQCISCTAVAASDNHLDLHPFQCYKHLHPLRTVQLCFSFEIVHQWHGRLVSFQGSKQSLWGTIRLQDFPRGFPHKSLLDKLRVILVSSHFSKRWKCSYCSGTQCSSCHSGIAIKADFLRMDSDSLNLKTWQLVSERGRQKATTVAHKNKASWNSSV